MIALCVSCFYLNHYFVNRFVVQESFAYSVLAVSRFSSSPETYISPHRFTVLLLLIKTLHGFYNGKRKEIKYHIRFHM